MRQQRRAGSLRRLGDHRAAVHTAAGEARGHVVYQKPDVGAFRFGAGIGDPDVAEIGAAEICQSVLADEKHARRIAAIGDGERAAGIGWVCRGVGDVDNTIAGAGTIGGVALVNSGTINANTVSTLFLNASTINAGKLEATASGGTLLLLGANISNTGTGTILASGSGARVDFNNATILGGKLRTSGAGAVIETQNGTTDLLSGCTIAAVSLLEVTSGATLKLSGGTIGWAPSSKL